MNMNRLLIATAFALGAIAVIWMGAGFIGSDKLALAVTVVIGCVYSIGFAELLQFRAATATLTTALTNMPEQDPLSDTALQQWLNKLDPSLHTSVRARIEGERVGLPAPVITPYLVGLLVMLGLLGTFVGMVDTLKGAVFALEGTTELQAIRAGLAAPINGLSLAFGTSVAGVAASAMLGLISTLSRRDRMLATGILDARIATVFRGLSLTHNRQETYRALQLQAQTLPDVAQRLDTMAQNLEQMGNTLQQQLLDNQQQFHESAQSSYRELAISVDKSLKESLADSGRQATENLKPAVTEIMTGMNIEVQKTHQQLANTASDQLIAFGSQFESVGQGMLAAFERSTSSSLERQEAGDSMRLERWSNSLGEAHEKASRQNDDAANVFTQELKQVTAAQQAFFATATQDFESMSLALSTQWQQSGEQMDELNKTMRGELSKLREDEAQRGDAALARLAELESTVASHLGTLGKELEEPMTRLIQTASETPRAAAQVIEHLRSEISNNIERDNGLLEERKLIMEDLNTLSGSLEKTSDLQRQNIENLLKSSSGLLNDVGSQFAGHVESELSRMSQVTDSFAGSVTQMSSLGDAFSLAINLFNESNNTLMEHLARIEDSMDKSSERSDEQMGYYVAQAREIIDQSMMSQKEVFDGLRQLGEEKQISSAKAS
ncbi:MAG: hypothetical protein V7709_17140 [Halioglobus sp.]